MLVALINRLFNRDEHLLCNQCLKPIQPQRWQYSMMRDEIRPYKFCKDCGFGRYSYATKKEAQIARITHKLTGY